MRKLKGLCKTCKYFSSGYTDRVKKFQPDLFEDYKKRGGLMGTCTRWEGGAGGEIVGVAKTNVCEDYKRGRAS